MSDHRRPIALALVAILWGAPGCATAQRVDAPSTKMSVREARASLAESMGYKSVKRTGDGLTFVDRGSTGNGEDAFVSFADVDDLSVETESWWTTPVGEAPPARVLANGRVLLLGGRTTDFSSQFRARSFGDAVLVLKAAALAPDTEEADVAAFAAAAADWRAQSPRPAMSDDALTFKLLAEDAFKRKEFAAALQAYRDALDRHPMWPDGHYNAALLAAEHADYELAAKHMRRYLALAPDAKDAARAKEKLLLWQYKAKE